MTPIASRCGRICDCIFARAGDLCDYGKTLAEDRRYDRDHATASPGELGMREDRESRWTA